VLEQVRAVAPEVDDLAWSNRRFLARAVRFLAGQGGLHQYLDCGSGLPTAENTHQIVRRTDREARVVYVDNDPEVVAQGGALVAGDPRCRVVDADVFRPGEVLGDAVVRELIDLAEPVALLQVGTLHHLSGDGAAVMRQYVDALAPGSWVVVAHFLDPGTDELGPLARRMEQVFLHSPMRSGWFRTRAEITGFLPGLELVPPGPGRAGELEVCDLWWPDGPRLTPLSPVRQCIAGAVGRKP
jgi:SAM-dependent methyltransferase